MVMGMAVVVEMAVETAMGMPEITMVTLTQPTTTALVLQ
jgi:hypothetical protein